ncbi:hypothetical protein BGS_0058 [Beggiatoa sp. SS]|nr:hypothetical protein BGS_0058 [Beggiatoa sp. SS]
MAQRSFVAQVAQKQAKKLSHYELVERFLNKTIKLNSHCSCPF